MKLLSVFTAALVLAGCATSGQVLPSGASHDKNASLLTASGDIPIRLRPLYNQSAEAMWTIPPQGLWVTEGDFLVPDCFTMRGGEEDVKRMNVPPRKHYVLDCYKKNKLEYEVEYEDVGSAPSE